MIFVTDAAIPTPARIFIKGLLLLTLVCLSACDRPPHEVNGFVEGELTYLSSQVAGILQQLNIKRGDSVSKGQVLYHLELEPEQSDVKVAEHFYAEAVAKLKDLKSPSRETVLAGLRAQINQAQAQSLLTEQRVKRIQKLFSKGAIDEDARDAAVSENKQAASRVQSLEAQLAEAELGGRTDAIQAAEASVEAAQSRLTRAQWLLAQKSVSSPGDGTVFDTFYQIGEFVPATKPVAALLFPDDIHIVFYLNSTQISKVHIGDTIQVVCSACSKKVTAKITYISPVAEFTPPVIFSRENHDKLVFRLLATSQDIQKLQPGQPVTITLNSSSFL